MVATRAQLRKASSRHQALSPETEENSPPRSPSPPVILDWEPTPPPDDNDERHQGSNESPHTSEEPESVNGGAALAVSRTRWRSWHDRALAFSVEKHRPFLQPHGQVTAAWQAVSADLAEAGVPHTVDAIQRHFKAMVAADKARETRRLQETGKDEEVDDHTKLMAQLRSLWEDRKIKKDRFGNSKVARDKAALETEGGKEIRRAAMLGLVPRGHLTDTANYEGAPHRERAGQRRKRRPDPSDSSASDKENEGTGERLAKKPRGGRIGQLTLSLRERTEETRDLLSEARKREDERTDALKDMVQGMVNLTQMLREHGERQDRQREQDHALMLGMLAARNQ